MNLGQFARMGKLVESLHAALLGPKGVEGGGNAMESNQAFVLSCCSRPLGSVTFVGRCRLADEVKQWKQKMVIWKGYSRSDSKVLFQEAAMLPIRELGDLVSSTIKKNELCPLRFSDFKAAMKEIRPSVSRSELQSFEQWNQEFGSN